MSEKFEEGKTEAERKVSVPTICNEFDGCVEFFILLICLIQADNAKDYTSDKLREGADAVDNQ